MRYHLSQEAARIMAEEGERDFHAAKCKAAVRLNQPDTRHLPSNREVKAALRRHLELFHGAHLDERLRRLRGLALEAMHFLAAHAPLLAGPVLSGTATAYSPIQLHVCADNPEDIALLLQAHRIPFDQSDKRLRFGGERYRQVPTYAFRVEDATVELSVFNPEQRREAPLSPVDGRPMPRATLAEVAALLAHP
ncbi:MAG: hypothetical protein A2150_05190 [Candidatus Muproteobacteria bacterium RBG_16_64_11]|uniref:Uncharacterized protein n=1 Tax=Candidatus Muproteobacteria bacterium RBG_16_64_11 TaxID=1817758 RepID=A0A1F6TEB7_9PROT|nr:MAG: hypothetical protein A2150_05190 [Candidatus Muproteobacteria bacterium RBG_16_64_11]